MCFWPSYIVAVAWSINALHLYHVDHGYDVIGKQDSGALLKAMTVFLVLLVKSSVS